MFDPEKFGEAMGEAIRAAVAPLLERIKELENRPVAPDMDLVMQQLKSMRDHYKGEPRIEVPVMGEKGERGADGLGLAGAMIDRNGILQITLSNGEVKSLGVVVGKDGSDGKDGISFESFDMEYLAETHEISIKASVAGRNKEFRYDAGGIRPAGYWREGTKAVPGEAWVHDGSLWIALKATPAQPKVGDDWIIAARKGRDGERGIKGADGAPPAPIKLKG